MRKILFLTFFFYGLLSFSQSISTLSGIAPGFVGNKIEFYEYEDYFSFSTKKLGEAIVKSDSTFSVSVFIDTTKKIKVSIDNYYYHIYVDPNSDYNFYLNGSIAKYKEIGRDLDLDYYFLDLDSTDINFKILAFESKLYAFLQEKYNHKNRSSGDFSLALEQFKTELENTIDKDSDVFYLNYVRFSIAQIDDLPFKGSRNRYEKYDFYIKPTTVWYYNDRYMEYIYQYYKGYYHQLSKTVNQAFYDGVVRSSPTLLMRALAKDYALDNMRLRELVVIRMMAEMYYYDDIPQTNVRVVLDSLSSHAAFEQNRVVAKNILSRVTDLVQGVKSPSFSIKDQLGNSISKNDLKGKYTYLHFLDASKLSKGDFEILKKLCEKYGDYVGFVSFVKIDNEEQQKELASLYDIPEQLSENWKMVFIDKEHYLYDRYKVKTFPYYITLDEYTNIYAAPALSPRPNNEYETIERFLFNIRKQKTERK
jgi:hypothetical protein